MNICQSFGKISVVKVQVETKNNSDLHRLKFISQSVNSLGLSSPDWQVGSTKSELQGPSILLLHHPYGLSLSKWFLIACFHFHISVTKKKKKKRMERADAQLKHEYSMSIKNTREQLSKLAGSSMKNMYEQGVWLCPFKFPVLAPIHISRVLNCLFAGPLGGHLSISWRDCGIEKMQNGVAEVAGSVSRELGLNLNLLLISWVTLGRLPKLIESQFHCLYEIINTFSSCHNVYRIN